MATDRETMNASHSRSQLPIPNVSFNYIVKHIASVTKPQPANNSMNGISLAGHW